MAERRVNPETGATYEKVDGRWVRTYDVADPGAVGAALIGAGRTFTQIGRGAQNLVGDEETRARIAQDEQSEAGAYGQLSRERGIATAVGEALPALATAPIGGGVTLGARGALGAARTFTGNRFAQVAAEQAALGGLEGGLTYNPNRGDQLFGGVLMAAAGAGGGALGEFGGEALQRVRAARAAGRRNREAVVQAGGDLSLRQEGAAELAGTVQRESVAGSAARTQAQGEELEQLLIGSTPIPEPKLERERLARRIIDMGGSLSRGQRLDLDVVKQAEAAAASNPLTSQVALARKRKNSDGLNRAALRVLGADDATIRNAELSPSVLGKLQADIGAQFDELEPRIGATSADDRFLADVGEVERGLFSVAGPERDVSRDIAKLVDLFEKSPDGVPPERLMQFRSSLAQQSAVAKHANEIDAYNSLVDAVDGVIERQAPGGVGEEYARARSRYRILKTIEAPGIVRDNRVMGGRLANKLAANYKQEYFFGGEQVGELADLFDWARSVQTFGDIVGDSGTATRTSFRDLARVEGMRGALQGVVMQGALELGGRVTEGAADVWQAGAGAAATPGAFAPSAGALARIAGQQAVDELQPPERQR